MPYVCETVTVDFTLSYIKHIIGVKLDIGMYSRLQKYIYTAYDINIKQEGHSGPKSLT